MSPTTTFLQLVAWIILLVFFFVAVNGVKKETGTRAQLARSAPNVLTSIGIFFTFLGIFIALINFSVIDISDSIPVLIGGLQLAFSSSVLGLGLSVAFRIYAARARRGEAADTASAGRIIGELKELNENTKLVREALTGEGEASLSTQFGKLRNDFRDFAEKMKDDGTQALVQALEEVIRDFNEKLSEQFGENFKQLNKAVGALLDWQREHKKQVEALTAAFEETRNGMTQIEKAVSHIPEHMQSIKVVFDTTEERLKQLYDGLESLSSMRESATSAVPILIESIDKVTHGMKKSMDEQSEAINEQLHQIQKTQAGVNAEIDKLVKGISDNMDGHLDKTEQLINDQAKEFQGIAKSLKENADDVLDLAKKSAAKTNDMAETFTVQLEQITLEVKKKTVEIISEKTEMFRQLQLNMNAEVERLVGRVHDSINNHLNETDLLINHQTEQFQELVNELKENVSDIIASTKESATKTGDMAETFNAQLEQLTQDVKRRTMETISEHGRMFRRFDDQMQEEIQSVIDKMGNNLTAITKKFVEIYEENIKRLPKIDEEFPDYE